MSLTKTKKAERWFTVIDALVIILVAALIVSAVVLFVLPKESKTERINFDLTLTVEQGSESAIKVGDRILYGGEAVAEVTEVTVSDATQLVPSWTEDPETKAILSMKLVSTPIAGKRLLNISVKATATDKEDGLYVGGTAVRVNGSFPVETNGFCGTATISALALNE